MTVIIDAVDFAVAAFRDDGDWQVAEVTHDHVSDVESLASALRRLPGDGAVGMVAIDDDFFVVVRVAGTQTRVLLSDVTAATEWELAASAVEFLGLPVPDDDVDDLEPAGDLELLSDLGMQAVDLAAMLDDEEAYPDEVLSDIARRIGFGPLFDDAVGFTSA